MSDGVERGERVRGRRPRFGRANLLLAVYWLKVICISIFILMRISDDVERRREWEVTSCVRLRDGGRPVVGFNKLM